MNQIDILAGLTPNSEMYKIRRERPEFVEGTELSRETVLAPKNGLSISHAVRAALAARMARQIGLDRLAATYDARLEESGATPLLATIASGAEPEGADDFLRAIVRHADLITGEPRKATREDIERLAAAGLSNPQIIAISELIAFLNYEARIITALAVLEDVE